jgi:putative glutamine amidotransferase
MRIAVSQREIVLKNAVGDELVFDGIERSWYSYLSGHELVPIGNTMNVSQFEFDCLLLTGGPDSYARHVTENMLYAVAVEKNIPILGICHGAFAVNDISGGINSTCQGHVGTQHSVYMEESIFQVNSYHSQSVKSVATNFRIVATDDDGNIEAFEHAYLRIYGVVWHPERMENPVLPTNVKKLLFSNES